MSLEDAQTRQAALDITQSVIVEAPAGSGKTSLLTQRYQKLCDIAKPEHIYVVTFTQQATTELKSRIQNPHAPISTIDALSLRYARQHIPDISLVDSDHLIQSCLVQWLMSPDLMQTPSMQRLLRHMDDDAYAWTKEMEILLKDRSKIIEKLDQSALYQHISDVATWAHHLLQALQQALGRHHILSFQWLYQQYAHAGLMDQNTSPLGFDTLEDLKTWKRIASFCLTQQGTWRKKWPHIPTAKQHLFDAIREDEALLHLFTHILHMPSHEPCHDEIEIIKAFDDVYRSLDRIMNESNPTDYHGIATLALQAATCPSHAWHVEHLLIDEYQDISPIQYQFLHQIALGAQTVFVVGDPMQSIYRFRSSDVQIFEKTKKKGLGGKSLSSLRLTHNFRSRPSLVHACNQWFTSIASLYQVPWLPKLPWQPSQSGQDALPSPSMDSVVSQPIRIIQANELPSVIQQHTGQSIALLGRTRADLVRIWKAGGYAQSTLYAFTPPMERYTIRLMFMVACALAHDGDEIAWASLLRLPEQSFDLHTLYHCTALIERPFCGPSWFNQLLKNSSTLSLSDMQINWIQSCLDAWSRAQSILLFIDRWMDLWRQLCTLIPIIESMSPALDQDLALFVQHLSSVLYLQIPDTYALEKKLQTPPASYVRHLSPPLHIMTIHQSKGLEFDVVIWIASSCKPRKKSHIFMQAQTYHQNPRSVLTSIRDMQSEPTAQYRYIQFHEQIEDQQEDDRLQYVAITRAKHQLYCVS